MIPHLGEGLRNLNDSNAHGANVQCPSLVSHGRDKTLIQLLFPILRQSIFGQPTLQRCQLPPSPYCLPWHAPCSAAPTPHNRSVRQLETGGFELVPWNLRSAKLHTLDVEPFRTARAVALTVNRWGIHLLTFTC